MSSPCEEFPDLCTFDEAVEEDGRSVLFFLREVLELLVEPMQLGVLSSEFGLIGLDPPDKFVEAYLKSVCELDESVQSRHGRASLPSVVDTGADVDTPGELYLAE